MRRLGNSSGTGLTGQTDISSRRLRVTIAEVSKRHVREILWCAFSRLIITKQAGASLALDVAHSRPHKVSDKTVIRPIAQFETAVHAVVSAIPFRTPHPSPRASIRRADARKLPVDDSTVDVAICSPPYLNAIDYLRGHNSPSSGWATPLASSAA
jgi:hypothetical protein